MSYERLPQSTMRNKMNLIVAVDKNFGIGVGEKLLCNLPTDLQNFKRLTLHKTVVMGKKTYDSLPAHPLPQRKNLVLTHNKSSVLKDDSIECFDDFGSLVNHLQTLNPEDIFIIGGANIYTLFLEQHLIKKMYITHILSEFNADVFFPSINFDEWNLIYESKIHNENGVEFKFCEYEIK